VTVDCGITSFEAVEAAKDRGIDVVITDHHEPFKPTGPAGVIELPQAAAIIDPKLQEGSGPWSPLSGAGIAFKVAQALRGDGVVKAGGLLDLAALGTAADVVPLVGDNRIIVREGCALAETGTRPGIRALRDAAGLKGKPLRISTLQFTVIPRINSAGRIADATDVVRLLLTESDSEAAELAEWLNALNVERQAVGEAVFEQALESIKNAGTGDSGDGVIVAAGEGWHPGVIGIVAARLADMYYRPAVVFSVSEGVARGSARSIPPFDIHDGLNRVSGLLKSFGGHKQAAGLCLAAADIDNFRRDLSAIFRGEVSGDALTPELRLDASVRISEISSGLISEIASLEPFGHENEEPLFGARGLEVSKARVVGSRHLKMSLKQEGREMDCIGFDLGEMLGRIRNGDLVDAAFVPVMNEWEGGRGAQLNIKALRPSVNGI
jgi:single-stranded-DNA-specific exonuclease